MLACDARQALTEDLPLAERVAATPAADLQFQSQGPALDGKVL
jgi:hypothetical protein